MSMLGKQCESLILNSFPYYLMLPALDPRELWWAQAWAMEIFRPVQNKLGLRRPSTNCLGAKHICAGKRGAYAECNGQRDLSSPTYTHRHTQSGFCIMVATPHKCVRPLIFKNWPKGALQIQRKTYFLLNGQGVEKFFSLFVVLTFWYFLYLLSIFSAELIYYRKNIAWLPWRRQEHERD